MNVIILIAFLVSAALTASCFAALYFREKNKTFFLEIDYNDLREDFDALVVSDRNKAEALEARNSDFDDLSVHMDALDMQYRFTIVERDNALRLLELATSNENHQSQLMKAGLFRAG